MEQTDCVVIGAGVVGLAVARRLALSGREVVILEAADRIGTEASSRTGEVIHAGIHYPPGCLRATLCVSGRDQLYAYCAEKDIGHSRLGELVVAPEPSAVKALEMIKTQAIGNGVDNVRILAKEKIRDLEPNLVCEAALLSPSTGIVDSHGLMTALLRDAEDSGAMLVIDSPVQMGRVQGDRIELEYGGRHRGSVSCRTLVNSAGIHAQSVAASLEGFQSSLVPPRFLCKGSYYTVSRKPPISRFIFSLPSGDSPGIHLSFDMAGQARFGPDAQWVEEVQYEVDHARAGVFAEGIGRYWPGLPDGALQPGFSGYFARTFGPCDSVMDWMIQGPADHGIPGLVNLFGIDSPGLTACMAIADKVLSKL